MTHNDLGRLGEDIAADFLHRHNYEIIYRNWRHQYLEIDIVASKDKCIHFIEVKTRSISKLKALDHYLSFTKFNKFQKAVGAYIDMYSCAFYQLDLIVINYNIGSHTLLYKQELYIP